MSELQRFYTMTKPPKHRRLKLIKLRIDTWVRRMRERITYLYYMSLYKLKILKRFSYRTDDEDFIPLPHNYSLARVKAGCVSASIEAKLSVTVLIDLDYLYKENKDGSKKIVHYFKSVGIKQYAMVCNIYEDTLALLIDGREFIIKNGLPVFRHAVLPPLNCKVFDGSDYTKKVEYETVEYDIRPLRALRYKHILSGVECVEDLTYSMQRYYYDFVCERFKEELSRVTLESLRIR